MALYMHYARAGRGARRPAPPNAVLSGPQRISGRAGTFFAFSNEPMATIHKEIVIDAPPERVWDAVRDVGAVHRRLVPGLVVDTTLDGEARMVTFASGLVVRERLVTIDDATRRFVYAATGGRATHHNASLQVLGETDGRTRLVWITDVLPDEAAGPISALVEQGARIMRETLARAGPSSPAAS